MNTLRRTFKLFAIAALAASIAACGGGGGDSSTDPTLNFSPTTAQLQGGWVTCDPAFDTAGNPTGGSEQEILNFNLNPAGGDVSMSITNSSFSSSNCSGTPTKTEPSVSLGLKVQGTTVLPDGSIVEKASISGTSRFGNSQVIKVSSSQLRFGDTSKRGTDGYPTALSSRVFSKR